MILPTAEKPDSQGVCFVGEIDVAEFLKEKLGTNPGPIITSVGKNIGIHDGSSFYTIGQERESALKASAWRAGKNLLCRCQKCC